ncbi:MAG: winged helix-turn-helix transcriptional regulator [Hyphomicrobiales bacterium]|nr:winged helix-turn-helix transcriptional regulator [Hyphomicrobiales bacterium]
MIDLGKKDMRAWTRLARTHALVTGALDARLKAAGLPPASWYPILVELEKADPGGLRPFEIEEATGEAQYNISRLLDRMTKAGLIVRAPCENDRRGWRIALAEPGRTTRSRMREIYGACLAERFVDPLSGKQIRALDEILGDLLTRAKKSSAPSAAA